MRPGCGCRRDAEGSGAFGHRGTRSHHAAGDSGSAANHAKAKGTDLVGKYAATIIQRADEPAVCLAYQLERLQE